MGVIKDLEEDVARSIRVMKVFAAVMLILLAGAVWWFARHW